MVERKKRKQNQRNNNDGKRNQKRRVSHNNNEKINRDELVVYRILCPIDVVGGVIGKSGKVINGIRHDTKAKIKVFDQLPGCSDRVITIYCSVKERKDEEIETITEPLCCAQDALLKVHDAIVASAGENTKNKSNNKIDRDVNQECRFLVPYSQCSSVIGKAGSNIKMIRSSTGASVKVVSKDVSDPSHACAMESDNIVVISGESESVKKALFAVSAIMYKISAREKIPLDSTSQDVTASSIVSSDLSNSVYSNQDHILQHKASVLSYFNALHVSDFQGYAVTAANPMPVFASSLPVVTHGFGGSFRTEELVLKVLCPLSNITRVIGKEGSTIERIREASGSRIEVNDSRTKCGDDDCVIIVTATESHDDMKSMAVEAVLLLQESVNDDDAEEVKTQLLVPSKVIGCVIGKSGLVINEIRKRNIANIHISKGNRDDRVEVLGEVSSVRDALIQIVLRLREDVLGDRDCVAARKLPARSDNYSFFSGSTNAGCTLPSFKSSTASTSGFHGYGSFSAEDNGFGSLGPYSFGRLHSSSVLEILIPANAMSKVMGKGGCNLENIRRISGALIEISVLKTSHGDHIALLSGTLEQMRSAENLFRAFILST
ncbi:PREDICTED: LOW QUALITY PROTEIN: KH domain-containing protein At4g18375-like [Camelina sativa]|uniref:LOW QUALITY PROTEIN: KH domain-containing protein At4g18375-like n=1 Tax=Camelina sativa TaxID=90675 RepID=A0ABM0U1Q0_CAMSA|nr:PREDICTED: LOW QUALITY PROTEIN: KH domain-containing protein At4g18375-like [Camelina sativa]